MVSCSHKESGGDCLPFFILFYYYFLAGSVAMVFVISATPHLLRLCPYYKTTWGAKRLPVCHFVRCPPNRHRTPRHPILPT
jgi:hypothetical protein